MNFSKLMIFVSHPVSCLIFGLKKNLLGYFVELDFHKFEEMFFSSRDGQNSFAELFLVLC